MLTNHYNVDENKSVSAFLREVKEKNNLNYIILNTQNPSFVDGRTIALKTHTPEEKLKHMKRPLSISNGGKREEHLDFLIETGEPIIATEEGDFFDYFQALEEIKKKKPQFLKEKLNENPRTQIYALNVDDKLSTARQLLIDHKINLLPVIDENLKVVGELRTRDVLSSNLFDSEISKEYFSEKSHKTLLNTHISNLMNDKPLTLEATDTLKDVVDLLLNKKVPSIIITRNEQVFSVISYKDVFKLYKKGSKDINYKVEITGTKELFDDEKALISRFAHRTAEKIAKRTKYNELKLVFKTHGQEQSGHLKRGSMTAYAIAGNKVISAQKEISPGTSDGEVNDKQKQDWNIPKLTQETLKALEESVQKAKH